ncbi:hypothetical protein GN956_G5736 [Arapaima gigas]
MGDLSTSFLHPTGSLLLVRPAAKGILQKCSRSQSGCSEDWKQAEADENSQWERAASKTDFLLILRKNSGLLKIILSENIKL